MPETVAQEIHAKPSDDPAVKILAETTWLKVEPTPPVAPLVATRHLGPGESAVLTAALNETGSVAILDDLAARRCAAALGVPVNGTLGLT